MMIKKTKINSPKRQISYWLLLKIIILNDQSSMSVESTCNLAKLLNFKYCMINKLDFVKIINK